MHDWQQLRISYRHGGIGSDYNLNPMNFELGSTYLMLPMTGLAPESDAQPCSWTHLPAVVGSNVRRVLLDAIQAYRAV